jgi:hypothetical protein
MRTGGLSVSLLAGRTVEPARAPPGEPETTWLEPVTDEQYHGPRISTR